MTSNFESIEPGLSPGNSSQEKIAWDKVEMLSAYMDGELTPAERDQVQDWLDHDPKIKRVYAQLLALQGQMQHSVAPAMDQSVTELTDKVFQSVDRHRQRRKLAVNLALGGGAIAASLLATVLGVIPGMAPAFRTADSQPHRLTDTIPSETITPAATLAVALNKPAINIPKAAIHNSLKLNQGEGQTADF